MGPIPIDLTAHYDAENRLKSIKDASNNNLFGSTIWADGTYAWVNTPGWNIYHMYDGDQEISETLGGTQFADNTIFRRYIRLPGSVDEPLVMINYNPTWSHEESRVWAHANRIGSVVATTDENGGDVERYKYSPYGVSGDEGDTGFPFRFTGQKIYADSGLYHYKARWYDPEVGRFLQTDPIGYEDQQNMYAYAMNDPLNNNDTTGKAVGKAIKFVRNTIKAKGNPIKGAIETGAGIADDLGTLADGQLNADDVGAVISLVTGLDKKDQAGIKSVAKNLKKNKLPKPPRGRGSVPKSERDPKRTFSPKEREAKRQEQGNKCANGCGSDIDKSNSEGHHIERHADGGPTTPENHGEVCITCHKELHAPDDK